MQILRSYTKTNADVKKKCKASKIIKKKNNCCQKPDFMVYKINKSSIYG